MKLSELIKHYHHRLTIDSVDGGKTFFLKCNDCCMTICDIVEERQISNLCVNSKLVLKEINS